MSSAIADPDAIRIAATIPFPTKRNMTMAILSALDGSFGFYGCKCSPKNFSIAP